ncbi:hypothetical protein [Sphingomonas koreensis]|uniref:hypothetical protein n=1 Tax=Sphingomonas koreensis TaxID=93064 RepID=UPI0009FA7DDD|nr:hypothetical protein [Sphingomonas koreensis]MDC7808702.1 hypothetical protein [Sphingomonas koreensis]
MTTAPAAQGSAPQAPVFGDPAAVDAAHRAVRADSSIQFDLPWQQPDPSNPPPRWLIELFQSLGRFVEWVGGGWYLLMWIAIAVAVVAILLVLFPAAREWFAARLLRRGEAAPEPPRWAPDAHVARALLDEADRLAAAGRYAEAVRLILHRSIEDIEKWRGDSLRPSLTSRDIAAFESLPDTARSVFRRIVADVERSLFGGNMLGEGDWTRARADYADFALGRR